MGAVKCLHAGLHAEICFFKGHAFGMDSEVLLEK